MLLGILRTSLLGNISAEKGALATSHGQGMNRAGQGHRSLNSSKNKKGKKNNKTDF